MTQSKSSCILTGLNEYRRCQAAVLDGGGCQQVSPVVADTPEEYLYGDPWMASDGLGYLRITSLDIRGVVSLIHIRHPTSDPPDYPKQSDPPGALVTASSRQNRKINVKRLCGQN